MGPHTKVAVRIAADDGQGIAPAVHRRVRGVGQPVGLGRAAGVGIKGTETTAHLVRVALMA